MASPASRLVLATALLIGALAISGAAAASHPTTPAAPDFGPNVKIFDPSMSTSAIKATVDAIAAQQLSNQFGTERYALLFMPGTYGSAADPLNFQVGLLRGGCRTRQLAERRQRERHDRFLQPVLLRRLHRARELLALGVEPDHQRRGQGRLPDRRVLGDLAGRADEARPRQRLRDAHGLLHGPVLRQRRLHRRLAVHGQHHRQRLAAAVPGQEQRSRRLDERRLEPGLRGRPRGAAAGLPRPALHDTRHQPRVAREAVPLRGLAQPFQRLRPRRAVRVLGHDAGPPARRPGARSRSRASSSRSPPTASSRSTTRCRAARTSSSRRASTTSTGRSG